MLTNEYHNLRSADVVIVILLLNGPDPTLVRALIRIIYNVPSRLSIRILSLLLGKLTFTFLPPSVLYRTSYREMIPLGVVGVIHDNVTTLDNTITAVSERGAVGPKRKKIIDNYVIYFCA